MGVYKDSLIVFGGFDGSRNNSVYSLNIPSLHWTLLLPAVGSSVPMPRSHHCLAITGSSMYIFGGLSEEAKLLCDLHVFDLERLVWKALNPEGTSPCGRINHSAHILGNFFLVFGGYDGKLRLNDIFFLNLDTGSWTIPLIHGTAPSRRLGHASVVAGDKLVIFGGDDGNKERELLNDLYILDLPSMRWHVPDLSPGCQPPQGRTHASFCTTSEDQIWLIDGSNSSKVKLDEIYRLDLSSLYLFQKMWIDRASVSILRDLNEAIRKIQLRTSLSTHLASKRNSPPHGRRKGANTTGSSSSSNAGGTETSFTSSSAYGIATDYSSSSSLSTTTTTNLTSSQNLSYPSGGPSSPLDDELSLLSTPNGEITNKRSKSQKRSERGENRDRSSTSGLAASSSSSAIPTSNEGNDERHARSPKKRRHKTVSRSTSTRRETSPIPIASPTSPIELSPTTSPRGTRDEYGIWTPLEEDENFDGSGHVVTFADSSSDVAGNEDFDADELPVIIRVRKTLDAIKYSFHELSLEKDNFLKLRQDRLALLAEAGDRDSTQGQELNRLLQQQKTKVTLNVGGSRFATSVATLTKFPDSMLATMFSGRHTLVPEADGTYFIDRDGTYFRYILNYLRCGADVVLEAKPSILAEVLAEARFYQLEGLKDAIQDIISDPNLIEEPIVEY
jgi:hypothetical protein